MPPKERDFQADIGRAFEKLKQSRSAFEKENPEIALGGAAATGSAGIVRAQVSQKRAASKPRQHKIEDLPHQPVKLARVSAERLAMLASARRNRMGDSTWAGISGFVASLPAAAHDVFESYFGAKSSGLAPIGLLEVAICVGFFAFALTSCFWDKGQSASQMLREILDPEGLVREEHARKEARRKALDEALRTIASALNPFR